MAETAETTSIVKRSPTGKSQRTRERILDAAAAVLSRKGYAGTRLNDVAELAEIASPAIYYYFPSRDDLIEEVLWTGVSQVRNNVEESLDRLGPDVQPLERIMVAIEAHLQFELELSEYTTASVRNTGQVPEHLRQRALVEEIAYMHLWRSLFEAAQSAGQLRDDIDLSVARLVVIGALNSAAGWWNPGTRSFADLVETTQKLVVSGLGANAESH